jgi:hypothetical protein
LWKRFTHSSRHMVQLVMKFLADVRWATVTVAPGEANLAISRLVVSKTIFWLIPQRIERLRFRPQYSVCCIENPVEKLLIQKVLVETKNLVFAAACSGMTSTTVGWGDADGCLHKRAGPRSWDLELCREQGCRPHPQSS